MIGPMEPWLCFELLHGHHLPQLRPDVKRILLRRALTQSVEDIAERESVSASTVRHKLDQALSAIFDTLSEPVPREQYGAGVWVTAHLECCLADQVVELKAEAREAA